MNPSTLVRRYLTGNPLNREEKKALAKQLKSATKASQAISMAKAEAAKACHDWQPIDPPTGWVAYCYIKFKCVWRVLRDGEIVAAYEGDDAERRAMKHAARLSSDVNAEYRGKVANPHA